MDTDQKLCEGRKFQNQTEKQDPLGYRVFGTDLYSNVLNR